MRQNSHSLVLLSLVGAVALGCSSGETHEVASDDGWGHPPLDSTSDLLANMPDPNDLYQDGKADEVFPSHFALPVTPIRSQGARGTCSFFAVAALFGQLLLQSGEDNPDVSEEYLHWLVKRKLGLYSDSEFNDDHKAVTGDGAVYSFDMAGDERLALGGEVYLDCGGGSLSDHDVVLVHLASDGSVERSITLAVADPNAGEPAPRWVTIHVPGVDGARVDGRWVLRVSDRVGEPNGTLRHVSLSFWVVSDGPVSPAPGHGGLNFSEYLEGGLGNGLLKAIELHNGGPEVDLGTCELRVYKNGATSFRVYPDGDVSDLGRRDCS